MSMKTAKALAGIAAATVIAFGSIFFFGTAMEHTATAAAACMESANDLRVCSRVDGTKLWEPVVCLGVLGFLAGVVCFIYGQSFRAKQK
jgi:hypothetical protein